MVFVDLPEDGRTWPVAGGTEKKVKYQFFDGGLRKEIEQDCDKVVLVVVGHGLAEDDVGDS